MKSNESMIAMFSRFTDIINNLAQQGQPVPDPMKVNKIPRRLSKEWNNIKSSIRETQRISPLFVDELVGTLRLYEVERLNGEGESRDKKMIVLKSNCDFDDTNSEDDEEDDKEMALMVKKFHKMARKRKIIQREKDLSDHMIKKRTSVKEKITRM